MWGLAAGFAKPARAVGYFKLDRQNRIDLQ
jgi:hypothetical protein